MSIRYFLAFFIACLFFVVPLEAALGTPALPAQAETISSVDLSREAMEAKLGRKLKFTERIALSVVRGKAKREARKQANNSPDGTVVDVTSLVSMILGILAFVFVFFTGYAFFLAVAALVMGIVGLGRVNRDSGYRKGKGFAIAGIALGGTWLFLGTLLLALVVLAFSAQ
jgi:hypothetical protein